MKIHMLRHIIKFCRKSIFSNSTFCTCTCLAFSHLSISLFYFSFLSFFKFFSNLAFREIYWLVKLLKVSEVSEYSTLTELISIVWTVVIRYLLNNYNILSCRKKKWNRNKRKGWAPNEWEVSISSSLRDKEG